METPINCPVCGMLFNSHETFTDTGLLVDEHLVKKHPDKLNDEELLKFSNPVVRHRWT